jgi:hypothetical protein
MINEEDVIKISSDGKGGIKGVELSDKNGNIKGIDVNCDYFALGLDFYEKEEWGTALYCFNNVIESDSNNYKAYIKRGNCYLNFDDFINAYEDFNRASKLNNEDYEEYTGNPYELVAEFSESPEYQNFFLILASNNAVLDKQYNKAKKYIEQAFNVYYYDDDNVENKIEAEYKKSFLNSINNTEELDKKNQELEKLNDNLEEKNKEMNNLIAMFAHNFLGTLQCIRSNAEHDNNAKIHLKTVKMMSGALTAFSIISADDDKLIEQLKQDNTGETNLLQNLANNLALAISQLLSKTNKDKIINLYLNYLRKTNQIEINTTSEELRENREYRKKWQALQHQWEDEFNALFSENVELSSLQNWLVDNFFPVQITGFNNYNIRFKEYGITDSIFLVVFMEILVNALKYMDVSQNQPLILTLDKQDHNYHLICENPSSQETYRGTHKGMDFLKSIARKLNAQFITDSTEQQFKTTFIIPAELLD